MIFKKIKLLLMQKLTKELETHHGIKMRKEDVDSIKSVMSIFKKLVVKILTAEPILTAKLLNEDEYSNENEDYQLTMDFYKSFKISDDGNDDKTIYEYIRLFVLIEYLLSIYGKSPNKIHFSDIIELRAPKIYSAIGQLSQLAQFRVNIDPKLKLIMSELDKVKQSQQSELKVMSDKAKYYQNNQITKESLLNSINIANNKTENDLNQELRKEFDIIKSTNKNRINRNDKLIKDIDELKISKIKLNKSIEELEFFTSMNKDEAELKQKQIRKEYKELENEYLATLETKAKLSSQINSLNNMEKKMNIVKKNANSFMNNAIKYDEFKMKLLNSFDTKEIDKLKRKVEQLKEDIDMVNGDVADCNNHVQSINEDIQQIKGEYTGLQQEFKDLNNKMLKETNFIEQKSHDINNVYRNYNSIDNCHKKSIKIIRNSHKISIEKILNKSNNEL